MTADRRLYLIPVLTAAIALSLLASACSSPGTGTTTAGGDTDTSSAASTASPGESASQDSADASRETAETRLEAIGAQLAAVLADYKNGKKQQAYTLAKSISANLYEGTTEGIVSQIDPADDRQIDSLLAATLPAAIQNGESSGQVAALVQRAQQLAESSLTAIHKTE